MKKSILALAVPVFGMLLAIQCEREDLTSGSGRELSLQPNQTVPLTDGLDLTLTELHDSRCPPNHACLVAGEAWAKIRLKKGGERLERKFCLEGCADIAAAPSVQVLAVGGESYQIAIQRINSNVKAPYEPIDATFVVTRK